LNLTQIKLENTSAHLDVLLSICEFLA